MAKKKKSKGSHKQTGPIKKKAVKSAAGSTPSLKINENYLAWGILGILAILVIIIRMNFLSIPMERDEGIYAYFGQLVLDGQTPYLDFHEFKFPGIYYGYALLIAIFGKTVEGLHVGILILNLATIYFCFLIGKKWFNTTAGIAAAVGYALLSLTSQASGFTTQSEHIVTFFASGGIALLIHSLQNGKNWQLFAAGVLICLSFLTKSNGMFFILFGGLITVMHYFFKENKQDSDSTLENTIPAGRDWMEIIKKGAIYSAGVFGIFGLVCLIMAAQGALSEMFYWTIEAPKAYVGAVTLEYGKERFLTTLPRVTNGYMSFWILAMLSLILVWLTKVSMTKKIGLLLFAVLSFFTITPGMRFYGHYWLQLMPCLAVMLGATFFAGQELLSKFVNKQMVTAGLGVVLFLMVAMNLSTFKEYYFNPNHKKVLRETYGMNPFPEAKVIGDYIKKRTTKEDKIVLIGSEPQIYFYADRRCPSEHAYFSYLMYDKDDPKVAQSIKEFKEDVERDLPKYVVLFNHRISILAKPNSDMTIFNWYSNYINKNGYKKVGMADMLSANETKYIWDDNPQQLNTYKPKSQFWIEVFQKQ